MRRLTLVAGIAFAAVACDDRTRVGHFDIYTPGRSLPDSHSRSSLYYGRRLLTERYGSSAIDPYNPDRILFAGDTEFNGPRDPCGTFLYDGRTDQRRQIAPWPDGLGELSWSPDGTCILLRGSAMPRVVELVSGEKTELADAVSKDGKQLEMYAMQWSPDSLRVAVFVRGQPHRRDGVNITDWDLVEVRVKPLAAEYVATIRRVLVDVDGTRFLLGGRAPGCGIQRPARTDRPQEAGRPRMGDNPAQLPEEAVGLPVLLTGSVATAGSPAEAGHYRDGVASRT